MIAYCDTSALFKVFVEEADSDRVVAWLAEADQAACSCVGFVEVHAALARRRDEGHLTAEDVTQALEKLRESWRSLAVVDLDPETAASMAMSHALRSLDAVHLAAAVSLSQMVAPLPVTLATFDRRLARVAAAVGLAVWPHDGEQASTSPD